MELLIKYTISLDYRVDYEQRRKIGNLIADKMLTLFPENIETIKKNEYLLGLAIENIETKINKLNNSKENGEKEKLDELKNKYNKGLKLLNNLTSTKLEKINKTDYDITKFTFDKTSIQFIKKKDDPNNKKAIILNLYFIIRKLINESMNKSIHNETVKINYIIKEEISEFEKKEKNVNPNQEILKKEERKDNNDPNANLQNINKTCSKNEIVNIMNKIEFKPITLEKDENLLEEIELPQKEKVLDSNLLEFYQHLKNIKNKIYNIRSEINFSKAIELFMEGEKSGLLEEKEINEDNKIIRSESDEDKKKIKKLLDESSKTNSIKLINSYFDNTITNINEALLHLNSIHFKTIEYIIDYAEFFDIKNIIKNLSLTQPLDPLEVINDIINKSRKSSNVNYVEQSFFICQVCMNFYSKEKIKYLSKIKEKLINLKVGEKIKLFDVKDKLINEIKDGISFKNIKEDLMLNVWEILKKKNN